MFIYDVENSIEEKWTMYLFISGQAKIAMNMKTYATFEEFGYDIDDDEISIGLIRSTPREVYNYDGAGNEHLVWKYAQVGTSWIYQENLDTEKRTVEAIEDVTVPAGTFRSCLKICQYRINDPDNPIPLTCEWVKPGFGMVKEIDFHTDNPPVVKLLNSKIKYP